ncbi:MAG TPA: GGDEF domain-containing protein [Smithellaceae bacterium]|nr:GGDEF domain-containing protein [Smithellaceae bacterium]
MQEILTTYSFDPRVLLIILTGVAIILAVIMNLILLFRKTYPGFGLWTMGITAFALGWNLILLRNVFPDIFTIVLANMLFLTAAMSFLDGIRIFRGKRTRKIIFIAIIFLYTIFQSYFTFADYNTSARIILVSFISAIICGFIVFELLSNIPADLRITSYLTAGVFILYSTFMLIRGILTTLHPSPQNFLEPNIITAITLLLNLFFIIAVTFSFIMTNNIRMEIELRGTMTQLQKMATTDPLTGIPNYRFFFQAGEQEMRRVYRYKNHLSVLMLDIDHFKKINDKYGHAVGDTVLATFADVCKKCLRDIDIFGRLGGEEFAVISPQTDIIGAKILAERLRTNIEQTEIKTEKGNVRITVSIGATELLPQENNFESVLKRADDAMYEAKRKGRNRVVAL